MAMLKFIETQHRRSLTRAMLILIGLSFRGKGAVTFGFLQTSLSQQPLRHIMHNNYLTFAVKNNSDVSNDCSSQSNKLIRILCLHGKNGNGPKFQKQLQNFERSLADRLITIGDGESTVFSSKAYEKSISKSLLDIDYLTAPYPMENDNHPSHDGEKNLNIPTQWWTLPEGTRSFNAKEYIGFDRSAKMVENAMIQKEYDFIIGHSQGAILLAAMIASSSSSSWKATPKLGYIFNGCAWPNPFTHDLENLRIMDEQQTKHHALFIVGDQDTINPPESALRVRDTLERKGGMLVHTVFHDGGHAFPANDMEALRKIIEWMVQLMD